MNELNTGLDVSDGDTVDVEEEADSAAHSGLTNGVSHRPNANVPLVNGDTSHYADGFGASGGGQGGHINGSVSDSSTPGSVAASQAYGGARPKTFKPKLRTSETSGARSRTSDSVVEIRVLPPPSCDSSGSSLNNQSSTDPDPEVRVHFEDVNSVPRLETRPRLGDSSRDTGELEHGAGDAAIEDDCYIYTYIGGTAYLSADLPNSFFRLDSGSDGESLPGVAGAGQSNLSTGVAALIQDQMVTSPHSPRVRSFSPSEDFIEMDFDPGSESDEVSNDGDSGQGLDGVEEEVAADEDMLGAGSVEDPEERPRADNSPPPVQLVLEHCAAMPTNNNDAGKESAECPSCDPAPAQLLASPTHPASAPVLSPSEEAVPVLMPRSKSLNSALAECSGAARAEDAPLCGSRLLAIREALLFGGEAEHRQEPDLELTSALTRLALPSAISTPVPATLSQKAMIWTEKEAVRKQVTLVVDCLSSVSSYLLQVTQTPNTSSCGAVALVNAVLALDLDVDPQLVADSVHTRLRRPDSSLPDYLLSRAQAGCTHRDLLAAADSGCLRDKLRARFFPLHNRVFQLSQLLASWIQLGLVPVLTLNVQAGPRCPDGQLQDSWHHQMVWGVAAEDVYLANPLDVMPARLLVPQVASPSELLIRRADIVTRFQSATDLSDINRLGARWRSMNVLGQVVNIVREERTKLKEEAQSVMLESAASSETVVTLTSHVNIPASYTAGVTLFCPLTNEEGLRCMTEAPDLPLKQ